MRMIVMSLALVAGMASAGDRRLEAQMGEWEDRLRRCEVAVEIKGFNEMGIKGPELLRLMSQGVIEFGTATLSYFAGDNPINEAIDLSKQFSNADAKRFINGILDRLKYQLGRDARKAAQS